jgi:alkanesulfonate monooxygenase SsuD/methylene tetrahydromethanopterin reductase-like flavin-dependent oxidoreductase (luciferase family)
MARHTISEAGALDYPYTSYDRARIKANRNRMIVGDQAQVKAQIMQLSEDYHTTEFMIVTITHDFQAKLNSYQLIKEAFKN